MSFCTSPPIRMDFVAMKYFSNIKIQTILLVLVVSCSIPIVLCLFSTPRRSKKRAAHSARRNSIQSRSNQSVLSDGRDEGDEDPMGEYQEDSEAERQLGRPGNEAFVWELLHDRNWQLSTEDVEAGWLEAYDEKVSTPSEFVKCYRIRRFIACSDFIGSPSILLVLISLSLDNSYLLFSSPMESFEHRGF